MTEKHLYLSLFFKSLTQRAVLYKKQTILLPGLSPIHFTVADVAAG